MKFYANRTRFGAIVTISVDGIIDDPKAAIQIGTPGAFEECKISATGYYDITVGPGKEIHINNGTSATFIAARTSP